MDNSTIIALLPYSEPFLFVNELISVDAHGASGSYTFHEESDFYKGHFKTIPVTPGVLLTECCAQIGVVCLGIYLMGIAIHDEMQIALSSSEMEFYLPVFPGEKVVVTSEKEYFRFYKLKCRVKMHNAQ